VALWKIDYTNRIVSTFDPDLGFTVDRNVGDVDMWGAEAQIAQRLGDKISLSVSGSYTRTELQEDQPFGLTPPPNPVEQFLLPEVVPHPLGVPLGADAAGRVQHVGLDADPSRFQDGLECTSGSANSSCDVFREGNFHRGSDADRGTDRRPAPGDSTGPAPVPRPLEPHERVAGLSSHSSSRRFLPSWLSSNRPLPAPPVTWWSLVRSSAHWRACCRPPRSKGTHVARDQ